MINLRHRSGSSLLVLHHIWYVLLKVQAILLNEGLHGNKVLHLPGVGRVV